MQTPQPVYTAANCHPAFRLNWTLALFWHEPPDSAAWLDPLKAAVQPDGVRILSHRLRGARVSQFLLSTRPNVDPAAIVRSVKGRLQHAVRAERPSAFQRNFFISSVGRRARTVIERYVVSQLGHHRMADARVQALLERFQFHDKAVDLSRVRSGAHSEFVYNLHVVLVNDGRWMEVREDVMDAAMRMIWRVGEKKGHLVSAVGVFADHVHLTIGCGMMESPEEVALSYMNNLAYCQGMRPVFQAGYYVGTFGEYDLGAIRRNLPGP